MYIERTVDTKPSGRTVLPIAVLLVFAAITVGINFLHTETGPGGRDDCPACQFLNSSLSTSPGIAIVLPALLVQGTLAAVEPLRSPEVVVPSLCSRSPPAV